MPEQDSTAMLVNTLEFPFQPLVLSLGRFILACIARSLFVISSYPQAPQTAPHISVISCHTTFRCAICLVIPLLELIVKHHHLCRTSPALADAALRNVCEDEEVTPKIHFFVFSLSEIAELAPSQKSTRELRVMNYAPEVALSPRQISDKDI